MTEKDYRPQEDIVALMTQFEQDVKDSPELPDVRRDCCGRAWCLKKRWSLCGLAAVRLRLPVQTARPRRLSMKSAWLLPPTLHPTSRNMWMGASISLW